MTPATIQFYSNCAAALVKEVNVILFYIFIQQPDRYNCESLHYYGPYNYGVDGERYTQGTSNMYVDMVEVNAGETITFYVKAVNIEGLHSDAVTINITAPHAGQ